MAVKIHLQLFWDNGWNRFCSIRVIQLCLCLAFKSRVRVSYGNNSHETVSYVRSSEVCILFFNDTKLPCICIDKCCQGCLKACQVSATLCCVDTVAESGHIFVKFCCVLESAFNFNPVTLSRNRNRCVLNCFRVFRHRLHKTDNTFFFVKSNWLYFFLSLVFIVNYQLRV